MVEERAKGRKIRVKKVLITEINLNLKERKKERVKKKRLNNGNKEVRET